MVLMFLHLAPVHLAEAHQQFNHWLKKRGIITLVALDFDAEKSSATKVGSSAKSSNVPTNRNLPLGTVAIVSLPFMVIVASTT